MFDIPKTYKEYCEPTFLCESNDPQIRRLAFRLTKSSRTQEDAVKKIFYWVRDNIIWKIEKIVGAKEILKRKPMYAICADKVNLFIALCRSIGIPAKYIIILSCELKRKNKNFPKSISHVAAEVFIKNKWKIIDPTFGRHTQKLIPISKFNRPSWKKIHKIIKLREFSRIFLFFSVFFLRISPSALKMKKMINETLKLDNL